MTDNRILEMTTGIIANFVANNRVSPDELPKLVKSISDALNTVEAGPAEAETEVTYDKPTTAQIRRSVSDGGLMSFLDGKTYKSLKRHLTKNGLTPNQYRERYGLRADYPMVAPTYSARRSELAKAMGLGVGGRKADDDGLPVRAKRVKNSKVSDSPVEAEG
ncbi:MucR family transcriptional regulator [Brevundimonas variabilis]|uniref:Putative transcriptional regulator n=1 Tax=Brevundimonas variabilis TaxID=74312 RepID=A0A7W9CGG0_9CAUL|nr:MucR family transcriptional regulator [Brevundimonas variabilis]MBB5745208.1 putative transcriptional regulator [Brevundimonas variabilis]